MGSPLGLVLTNIFMVDLENTLVPTLIDYMKFWEVHVDDTICSVKMGSVEYIVSILNSFYANTQFIYKIEKKCR